MSYRNFFGLAFLLLLSACGPSPVDLVQTVTPTAVETAVAPPDQTATPSVITATATSPVATEQPSSTPAGLPQFIAYVRDGQLLVTEISNGVLGGTTQYSLAGESDRVMDIQWSPSGEFVAFVSVAQGDPHVFYIYALGQSSPVDLGLGSAPAWSPDSRSLAYVGETYPNENIWMTTIDNPAPHPLTFESNHAWGRPVFAPDGQSLIVATADRINMGAQGNTSFILDRLELDGSGTRTPLPGAAPIDGGRLPYDLRFSPDDTRLAFSTSMHFSACASPGEYYVSDVNGGNRLALVSPSLKAAIDPASDRYHVGLTYAWSAASDALVASGTVVDCDFNSPTMGQVLAGPQLSILRMDGSEGLIIPGMFYSPSMDRTGTLIAVAHYKDLQDLNPMVVIYSAHTGQLVLPLGPGNSPQLQP